MLDLQPGVHLDEVELAVLVEELDGPGAGVVDLRHRLGADPPDPEPGAGVDHRRRRLLEHLLVPALQRAVALAEVHGAAPAVAEDLHLDVPRLAEVLLEVDLVVAERGLGLGARGREGGLHVGGGAGELHAAAAAAGGRLDDHRVAELPGDLPRLVERRHRAVRAGHAGDAELAHRLLGGDLVAHQPDVLGGRADEDQAVVLDHVDEGGVLGEEAVAGMDRLGAGDLAGGDDVRHRQVALARRRRADADALVGHADVHGVRVGGRMDRHGLDAHLLAGAVDAQRDLAPVRDQHLLEHGARLRGSGSPVIRGSRAARRTPPAGRPRPGGA